MERVLEVLESLNSEHQQMRNPATMQFEASISVIQMRSELCSELLRQEPAKEATVKVAVQYHQDREESNHCVELILFARPVVRTYCINNSGELFDTLWTARIIRHIALRKVGNKLSISSGCDIFAQERCLDFQDCRC